MSDLVKTLRHRGRVDALYGEAADTIESLEDKVSMLKAVIMVFDPDYDIDDMFRRAGVTTSPRSTQS